MNRKQYFKWLLSAAICILLFGCQQIEEDGWGENTGGILKVGTRSVENEEIPYPISLYAFSEDGDCIATQVVENKKEEVQLELASGRYRIVAVAGYSDDYVLPSVNRLTDVIEMNDEDASETPLMMGMADVKLDAKTEDQLEIILSYSVSLVDVVLSNVPTSATEVVVTMSSFYSSMNLKGEYLNPDYSFSLTCALDTLGQWSAKPRYVFPGSSKETVLSIAFRMKDGTKSTYGYIWKDSPKANQGYHLKGDYSGNLALNGVFVIAGWEKVEEVEFAFGSNSKPDDEDEDSDLDLSALPEVGSFWNGSLVVDVGEVDDSGAEVLLMSLEEWILTTSQIDELISGYSVNGLSQWRLPTYEEAQLLKNNYSDDNRKELNERIAAYDGNLVGIDGEERYLCLKSNVYYSFIFSGSSKITKAGDKRTYNVRLVKSHRISLSPISSDS